ncbi:MAG: TetR/AcrR family transcriptional regulator [Planctomycetota bacterium]|nr:TetR/AcrR family transcriptional regulator [Planctomycetota bacterium]
MDRAEQTRNRIQDIALRLFTERGFDNVTVEEITQLAGTSHMTFYRNFPTKESAVFDDPFDPMIGAAVAEQNDKLPPMERTCLGLLGVLDQLDDSHDGAMLARIRLALDSPSLRAHIWENTHRTEEVIVEALVDGGTPQSEARVAAGAVLGAMSASLINWAREDAPVSYQACLRDALTYLRANDSGEKPARLEKEKQ